MPTLMQVILDATGIYRCRSSRRREPRLSCDVALGSSRDQSTLTIRCRGCRNEHVFGVKEGRIEYRYTRAAERPVP